MRAAPAVSCARCTKESTHEHTGSAEAIRHSLRNGLRLIRALPGDRAFLSPSPPRSLLLKSLTPASRRRDHTTSPSASGALVNSAIHVHRVPPRVRDDHDTPLAVGWDAMRYSFDLGTRSTAMTAAHCHDGQINRAVRNSQSARQPLNSTRSADLRFAAHSRLKPDIARGTKSARSGSKQLATSLRMH